MKFKSEVNVTGIKRAKGDFEGTAYDSTTIYIEVGMDETQGNARGMATQDFKIGTSAEYDKFVSIPLPFKAMAEFELTTNGKTQRQRVVSLVPVRSTANVA